MKFTLHILLAFYLVLKPLAPVLDYAVNYDYISKVLCINKDKPQIHCNGKCYVGKELAKNESQNDSKTKNSVQKVLDFYVPEADFCTTSFQLPSRLFLFVSFTHFQTTGFLI